MTKREIRQARELRHLNEILRDKNLELDALHYVWCDGGCDSGTHRWQNAPLTEEIVLKAKANTIRLEGWWKNKQFRKEWDSWNPIKREEWMNAQIKKSEDCHP